MKRLVIAGMLALFLIAVAGCSVDKDAEPTSAAAEEQSSTSNDELMGKDRVITELEKEINALKEQVAKLKQAAEEKKATAEEAVACPDLTYEQEPLKAKDYTSYQKVDSACYSFYIPQSWSYRIQGSQVEFVDDRTIVGSTEVQTYLNRSSLENYVANHAEQTGFKSLGPIVPITGIDAEVNQIQLRWTKPAAAGEPDWKYDETRVYVSIKPLERSFGFYFSTEDVPEDTVIKVVSSFRLSK